MKPHSLSHKIHAVRYVRNLMSAGQSLRAACREANVPLGSFQVWQERMEQGGEAGLAANYSKCGRKPKWALTPEESTALRGLVLVHDSQTFAIEQFARAHPECRPETRQAVIDELEAAARQKRYPRWPISIRRAACVTPEDRALLRGSRTFESISFSPRKGLFFVDDRGVNVPLSPHVAWVMDDYSTNEPYMVDADDGGQRLCRQTLAAMDVFSDAWLGVEMIGRERDAYRAEDIVRFILRCIDAQGTMPGYLLLERGRWDSTGVHGLDLEKELGPKFAGRLWGGLDALFTIIHGYSSRHKASLESSFNILQRALAHSGREIGRHRGEFEAATRDYLAVQAGRRDAAATGFLTQDDAREAHWRAMQMLNMRGKHRAASGTVEVPGDLLDLFEPERCRALPESERWRFLPVKRKATVRGGFVEMSVAPYRQPFRFQINGVAGGPNLPSGYNLLVAFDPAMPALGAHVCNGEAGRLNAQSLPVGDFICLAPNAMDAPQFDLRSGGYKESGKRRASTAARTAFAAINPLGRRGLAVTQRQDGEGNASIARTGALSATAGISGHKTSRDPLDMPETTDRSAISHPQSAIRNHQSSPASLRALEDAALEHLSVL